MRNLRFSSQQKDEIREIIPIDPCFSVCKQTQTKFLLPFFFNTSFGQSYQGERRLGYEWPCFCLLAFDRSTGQKSPGNRTKNFTKSCYFRFQMSDFRLACLHTTAKRPNFSLSRMLQYSPLSSNVSNPKTLFLVCHPVIYRNHHRTLC